MFVSHSESSTDSFKLIGTSTILTSRHGCRQVVANGHLIKIQFKESPYNSMRLIPSFEPFRTQEEDGEFLFQLTVDDELPPVPKDKRERLRAFDTGNGETVVDMLPDGGYQYIIRDIEDRDCCLLQCNKDFSDCKCALNGYYNMRCFGLNNALMLIYAFAGSLKQTLLIHASGTTANRIRHARAIARPSFKGKHPSQHRSLSRDRRV